MMSEVGKIRLRTPQGKPSVITVSKNTDGGIDIHLTRSEEGEALFMLPKYAAKRLGELLAKATEA
jgi:hypothetical protein